ADDEVVAVTTGDDVIAVPTVERELHRVSLQGLGVDDVIPAQGVDCKTVEGWVLVKDGDLGVQAGDAKPADVAANADGVVALGPVHGDRVGRAVGAAVRAAQGELDVRQVGAGQVVDGNVVGAAQRPE